MATLEPEAVTANLNKALFINGCEKKDFERFLKEFTGDADCINSHQTYVWGVDNKYYSADILLSCCHVDENCKIEVKEDNYEAVVIVAPPDKCSVGSIWTEVCRHMRDNEPPAVCLLVVLHYYHENYEQELQEVLCWCVGNGFELIEWKANGQKGMEEDAENETKGTERLAEALQAHVWPTLHMKNSGGVGLPESLSSRPEQVEQSPHCPGPANTNALSEEGELLATGIDGEQDPGGESFEQLFAKFADMKEHAQQLSHEERKAYAEKVVLAFWDAIGGDKDEV